MRYCKERHPKVKRVIVITDEQDCSATGDEPAKAPAYGTAGNYLINVASYRNGIGYRNGWTHVDGFSEAVLRYIAEIERKRAVLPIQASGD
jgi:60 kDa SS-A/Ro ribonucleoprotein